MDAEDAGRIAKHLEKLLAALQRDRVLTNTQIRAIAGSRGMARVSELKHRGHQITVRKLTGAIWEVRYESPPLARSAETPMSYPDADCGPLFRSPGGERRVSAMTDLTPRYVIETEAEAVRNGSWWWWSPWCVPGWNPDKDAAELKRELQRGVISLREAQRLHRQGLA